MGFVWEMDLVWGDGLSVGVWTLCGGMDLVWGDGLSVGVWT